MYAVQLGSRSLLSRFLSKREGLNYGLQCSVMLARRCQSLRKKTK